MSLLHFYDFNFDIYLQAIRVGFPYACFVYAWMLSGLEKTKISTDEHI